MPTCAAFSVVHMFAGPKKVHGQTLEFISHRNNTWIYIPAALAEKRFLHTQFRSRMYFHMSMLKGQGSLLSSPLIALTAAYYYYVEDLCHAGFCRSSRLSLNTLPRWRRVRRLYDGGYVMQGLLNDIRSKQTETRLQYSKLLFFFSCCGTLSKSAAMFWALGLSKSGRGYFRSRGEMPSFCSPVAIYSRYVRLPVITCDD